MTYSAQLESEAERTRADLASSLQELRARLTIGQVFDEVWQFTRDTIGRDFARNLRRQVTENPLPTALIGAGVVWLMVGRGDSRPRRLGAPAREPATGDGAVDPANEDVTAGDATHVSTRTRINGQRVRTMVRKAQSTIGEAANNAASTISDTAGSVYDTVTEGASRAASTIGETVSHTYDSVAHGASRAAERTNDTMRRMATYAVEHPLVLAGLGLALGAAIGAALPLSRTENRLLGPVSDDVKRRAERLAAQQLARAERVGEQAIDRVAEAADRQFMRGDEHMETPPPSETRH